MAAVYLPALQARERVHTIKQLPSIASTASKRERVQVNEWLPCTCQHCKQERVHTPLNSCRVLPALQAREKEFRESHRRRRQEVPQKEKTGSPTEGEDRESHRRRRQGVPQKEKTGSPTEGEDRESHRRRRHTKEATWVHKTGSDQPR